MSVAVSSAQADTHAAPVILRTEGRLARITLNRPRTINSLDHEMVRLMASALDEWARDSAIAAVVLDGAGERGLCAGGALNKDGGAPLGPDFLRDEYHLNAQLAEYRKPLVALMDGIVMGGGIGVSGHASHRVVTERSRLAMPETRIGMIPDVGGSVLLGEAPGLLGRHLGLTSATFNGADAIACGFADTMVESERLPALVEALREAVDRLEARATADLAHESVTAVIRDFAASVPESPLLAHREWIDRCYAPDSVASIVQTLEQEGSADAEAAASAILAVSPTAAVATLELLRRTEGAGLREALELEYRGMTALAELPDAREGVRALLVDRDRPRWQPAELGEVDETAVARMFEQPGPGGSLF